MARWRAVPQDTQSLFRAVAHHARHPGLPHLRLKAVPRKTREDGLQRCRKGTYRKEEILGALHQVEAGTPISEVCRKLGVSTATFYLWRNKYSGLGLNELRELRQLRDENSKLKRLVADLSLDRHMLQELISKKL